MKYSRILSVLRIFLFLFANSATGYFLTFVIFNYSRPFYRPFALSFPGFSSTTLYLCVTVHERRHQPSHGSLLALCILSRDIPVFFSTENRPYHTVSLFISNAICELISHIQGNNVSTDTDTKQSHQSNLYLEANTTTGQQQQ